MPERIPASVISEWNKLKHDLLPTIEKAKELAPTAKARLKTAITKLYSELDSGLQSKLKTCNSAKTDKDATVAIGAALNVARGYKTKIATAVQAWGPLGVSMGKRFEKRITEIIAALEAALIELGK